MIGKPTFKSEVDFLLASMAALDLPPRQGDFVYLWTALLLLSRRNPSVGKFRRTFRPDRLFGKRRTDLEEQRHRRSITYSRKNRGPMTNRLLGTLTAVLFTISATLCFIVGSDSLFRHMEQEAAFGLTSGSVLAVFTVYIWRGISKPSTRPKLLGRTRK